MSLDRKSTKKQVIDLSANKRENNFNKAPTSSDPKILKMKSITS